MSKLTFLLRSNSKTDYKITPHAAQSSFPNDDAAYSISSCECVSYSFLLIPISLMVGQWTIALWFIFGISYFYYVSKKLRGGMVCVIFIKMDFSEWGASEWGWGVAVWVWLVAKLTSWQCLLRSLLLICSHSTLVSYLCFTLFIKRDYMLLLANMLMTTVSLFYFPKASI